MQNGSYATKEQILKAEDLIYEDVHVPEWKLTVRVRSLTGVEFEEYQRTISSMRQEIRGRGRKREVDVQIESHVEKAMLKLCGLTMVDGDGNRLFSDHELEILGQKNHRALMRVHEVAARLSGLTEEALESEGKDSETTDGDVKPSESPGPADASPPASSSAA